MEIDRDQIRPPTDEEKARFDQWRRSQERRQEVAGKVVEAGLFLEDLAKVVKKYTPRLVAVGLLIAGGVAVAVDKYKKRQKQS